MLVYLSALFPCLAFTYLLRGLDIFTVFLMVGYTCLESLALAMVGLLLATLSPSRQRQIAQGVLFAALLVFLFVMNLVLMGGLISTEGMVIESQDFWEVNAALAILYVNAFAVVFLAARSLLTAACQNRSTALRVGLAVAHLSFIGWIAWTLLKWDATGLYVLLFFGTIGWYFCGALAVGESPVLSPRVKRELPQSWMARVFLTWFAPGPGTGYVFVLSNMLMMSLVAVILATGWFDDLAAELGIQLRRRPNFSSWRVFETAVVATSYIAIYLGLGKLILSAARRFDDTKISLRILVLLLLGLLGGGVPWVIQITYPPTRNLGYTLLQITNPVWTMWECCTRSGLPAGTGPLVLLLLPLAAALVFLLNVPSLIVELRQVRISKPPRVAEEDRALAAALAPEPGPSSPWD
jgi:hypothetical protein